MTPGVAPASAFRPNPWNPNKMQPRDYARLIHDIELFGFVDPLTVRPDPKDSLYFQIIDGENRWRAGRDLGLAAIPYFDIGPVDDATAKKLTIALNELRGQYDPKDMSALLQDLLRDETPAQILEQLPFSEEALAGLVGMEGFDWKGLDRPEPKKERESGPRWVERTFRLPPEADEVIQQALDKAKSESGGEMVDGQALELIAADYLASP